MFRRLLLLCLLTCCAIPSAIAADGYMVTVTAVTAPIKSEDKVLGTVTRGTRLWVFEEKGKWVRVKVPGKEDKGWLAAEHAQRVQLTASQQQDFKLASAHWEQGVEFQKQGDLADARQEFDQSLAKFRRVHGTDHPDVAVVLNHLGMLAKDQREFVAARKYYEEGLAIKRSTLGNEHSDTRPSA